MNIKIEQIAMLGNRILIKADPAASLDIVSTGGLVTATGKQIQSRDGIQSLENQDPPTGKIIAVGPDVTTLSPGDRVLFSPFSGKKLMFMLEEYIMMSEPEPVMKISSTN